MNQEWEVARPSGRCAATGREFAEGEQYYAVLVAGPSGLERRDYCLEAWAGPPADSICHWKARGPVRDAKAASAVVDTELLLGLFSRLEDDPGEASQQLRFIIALLLMRKRRLRVEGTSREGEAEYWQVRVLADGSLHQLLNPRLDDARIDQLSRQLLAILSGEMDFERPDAPARDPTDVSGSMPGPESEVDRATP